MTKATAAEPLVSDHRFALSCFAWVPYWINSVAAYKDVHIVKLADIDHTGSILAAAMEETGIPYIDVSPIGRVHKVVDDFLYQGRTLTPLTDEQLARSDRDAFAEQQLAAYVSSLPRLEQRAYGAPLLTTLFNATLLNQTLRDIKQRRLDENVDFVTTLRTTAQERRTNGLDQETTAITDPKQSVHELLNVLRPFLFTDRHTPALA